jgi:glycosyltransferase involved in cell wall biosynthesis
MTSLAERHEVHLVTLQSPDGERVDVKEALRGLVHEVRVVQRGSEAGLSKRIEQVLALASRESYLRKLFTVPALQVVLDDVLGSTAFDAVVVEFPFMAHYDLSRSPPGVPPPRRVLDEHNIEFDLARQMAGPGAGLARRFYNAANWRRLRREELGAWRAFDGVAFTSAVDDTRARGLVPGLRSAVVPNGVDVAHFAPRATDPRPEAGRLVFFGTFNYFPNVDGVLFMLREIWPLVVERCPDARLQIIGADPPEEIRRLAGPGVELSGFVDDLRPHLARAAGVVVPLRMGGGTRLKVVEAMAMGRPIVATSLGAEGIEAEPGREILLADGPAAFAEAVVRLLGDPALGERMGRAARALAVERYGWGGAARILERLLRDTLADGRPARERAQGVG